ncbi:MAG: DUF805 domain-containing protein [Vampirovibrionales bacterium]
MEFKEAVIQAWQKRWNFSGRASRSECNWDYLFHYIVSQVVGISAIIPVYLLYDFVPKTGTPAFKALVNQLVHQGWWTHPLGISGALVVLWVLLLLLSYFVFWVLVDVPVYVRRLHDLNRSGWWLLTFYLPVVGFIWLIVSHCKKGTEGPNRYGEDPLALEAGKPTPPEAQPTATPTVLHSTYREPREPRD